MRTRKIVGLLFSLLQLIFILKLIELVRGQEETKSPELSYVNSIPYPYANNPNANANGANVKINVNSKSNTDQLQESQYPAASSDSFVIPIIPDSTVKVKGDNEDLSSARFLPAFQQRKKKNKKKYHSYWTSTEEPPQTTLITVEEEVIDYNENGTEIKRENVTKIVIQKKKVQLCPDMKCKIRNSGSNIIRKPEIQTTISSTLTPPIIPTNNWPSLKSILNFILDIIHQAFLGTPVTEEARAFTQAASTEVTTIARELEQSVSRQLQNIRQSTLPLLIILLKFVAGFIAFQTFLLLWKINYYTVQDPYVTSGPVDSSDFAARAIQQALSLISSSS